MTPAAMPKTALKKKEIPFAKKYPRPYIQGKAVKC
jgi:hypothetical protein